MPALTPQRRLNIFVVGAAPIAVSFLILAMAAQIGVNVLSLMTSVESRNARDYTVRSRVFGITVHERPAT